MVTPAAKREAALWVMKEYPKISQRRAARLLTIPRSTLRYKAKGRPEREKRRALIRRIALEKVRFGYRRVRDELEKMLGVKVGKNSVQRIMREEQLQVRSRRRRKWIARTEKINQEMPAGPDQKWAMDFVWDWCLNKRKLKVFTLVDRFTREALAMEAGHSFPARQVVAVLEGLKQQGRCPQEIRVDNGPEFISHALSAWCGKNGVMLSFIKPGKPTQNGHIESLNGKLRDECLNLHYFEDLEDARRKIGRFWREYNYERPHSALGGERPAEFAARHGAKCPVFASSTINTATLRRTQGNPFGLGFAPALTSTTRRRQQPNHGGEAPF